MKKPVLYAAVLIVIGFIFCINSSFSQTSFPTKHITLLVHTSPGSGSDRMARQAARILEKYLGQPVVCENRVGGQGSVALSYMLGQPADGYLAATVTMSQLEAMASGGLGKITDPSQLMWLGRIQGDTTLFIVKADSPFKTVQDVLAAAAKKTVTIGSYGAKTLYSVAAANIRKEAKVDLKYIPYEGAPEALRAVLGGEVEVGLSPASVTMSHIRGGTVRALAALSEERDPTFPDVPTLKELGTNVVAMQYRGIAAKPGMPQEAAQKWEKALKQLVEDAAWIEFTAKDGMVVLKEIGDKIIAPIVKKEFEKAKTALDQ